METVNQDINPTQIQFTDEEKSAFMKPKNLVFTPLDKLGRCSSKTLQHSVMIIRSIQCHNYYRPFSTNVPPVAIHYSSSFKNVGVCSWEHCMSWKKYGYVWPTAQPHIYNAKPLTTPFSLFNKEKATTEIRCWIKIWFLSSSLVSCLSQEQFFCPLGLGSSHLFSSSKIPLSKSEPLTLDYLQSRHREICNSSGWLFRILK